MTRIQLHRWYRKLFEKVTDGDGYQSFGYDLRTLQITHPGFYPAYCRLQEIQKDKMYYTLKDGQLPVKGEQRG